MKPARRSKQSWGSARWICRCITTAAAALLLASCGAGGGSGGGGAPPNPTVARVVVSPANASVDVGKTVALSAQAFDATSATLTRTFTWTSSDTS